MSESLTVLKFESFATELCPLKASEDSAAFDLKAAEDLLIRPGETLTLSTGLKLAIPTGYEAQIRPRSGLSLRSRLRLANSPGTIDADYRDELKIILHNNFSQAEIPTLIAIKSPLLERFGKICEALSLQEYLERHGREDALPEALLSRIVYLDEEGELWGTERIHKSERVAQILLAKLITTKWQAVEDVTCYGKDRGGGFGHSGQF